MDDQKLRVFNAIAAFIEDLNVGLNQRQKQIALYNRLIKQTTLRDQKAIDRHIDAFKTFFDSNPNYILSKQLGCVTRIVYSQDHVYIDIGKILSKVDKEATDVIHQHLTTIYSLMNIGTAKGKEALEALKQETAAVVPSGASAAAAAVVDSGLELNLPKTAEGDFIKNTLDKMTSQFNNIEVGPDTNPMALMGTMMNSGFFTEFVGTLQTKFSSGEMNIGSLMQTVTGVISQAAPSGGGAESSQLRTFVDSAMSQVGAMAAASGNQVDPQAQQQVNSMLSSMMGPMMGAPPAPPPQDSPVQYPKTPHKKS